MTTLLSVDPGLREAGVALFEDDTLVRCDCVYENLASGPKQWVAMARAIADWVDEDPDKLAIERMETRPGREDAHDDIIQLTYVSGGVYACLAGVDEMEAPRAGDWTKKRPKRINHRRVRKRLGDAESLALEDGLNRCLAKNDKEVLDAVGIGLFTLNRWR